MKAQALSIIIPVYNEEDYLFDCLTAIEKQTVMPDEVIVVDNNSSDNSVAIAKRFSFVTLVHETRQGLFYSRQTGMNMAKGDILCRIDADTIVDTGWVEHVKHAFKDTSVHALTGPLGYHDFIAPRFARWLEHMFLVGAKKQGYDFLFGCNMAVRAKAWQKITASLCNESFIFEDIDIAIHLKGHGIVPHYARRMSAHVSARRSHDRPKDFMRYIGGHSRTFKHHGIKKFATNYSEWSFIAGYLLFRPFIMAFDPHTRKFSYSQYKYASKSARPDPMNVD